MQSRSHSQDTSRMALPSNTKESFLTSNRPRAGIWRADRNSVRLKKLGRARVRLGPFRTMPPEISQQNRVRPSQFSIFLQTRCVSSSNISRDPHVPTLSR
jgi:hypothetical protein